MIWLVVTVAVLSWIVGVLLLAVKDDHASITAGTVVILGALLALVILARCL